MGELRHGSLFSGIGGFDYAARQVGWTNVFAVEKDKWCRELLKLRFPTTEIYQDIKDFSGHEYNGKIDVISGGFPCQPFSVAGKQKGKEDDRYLWPEMLRVISEVRPTWVVGENVTGIIKLALDEVLLDLENIGYTCQTFIIPACAVNASHRRSRIWIVAHNDSAPADNKVSTGRNVLASKNVVDSDGERELSRLGEVCGADEKISKRNDDAKFNDSDESYKSGFSVNTDENEHSSNKRTLNKTNDLQKQYRKKVCAGQLIRGFNSKDAADTSIKFGNERIYEYNSSEGEIQLPTGGENSIPCNSHGNGSQRKRKELNNERQVGLSDRENAGWRTLEWPTEPPLCGANDGISRRVDRLRGLGNAVVPQVVMEIFNAINTIENA